MDTDCIYSEASHIKTRPSKPFVFIRAFELYFKIKMYFLGQKKINNASHAIFFRK